MVPIFCRRCKQTFDTVAGLESHSSVRGAEFSCDYREVEEPAGITSEMAKKLKERWRGATTGEKWHNIYTILFPNEEAIPVPCKSTRAEIYM